jgi:hypothetical protein
MRPGGRASTLAEAVRSERSGTSTAEEKCHPAVATAPAMTTSATTAPMAHRLRDIGAV